MLACDGARRVLRRARREPEARAALRRRSPGGAKAAPTSATSRMPSRTVRSSPPTRSSDGRISRACSRPASASRPARSCSTFPGASGAGSTSPRQQTGGFRGYWPTSQRQPTDRQRWSATCAATACRTCCFRTASDQSTRGWTRRCTGLASPASSTTSCSASTRRIRLRMPPGVFLRSRSEDLRRVRGVVISAGRGLPGSRRSTPSMAGCREAVVGEAGAERRCRPQRAFARTRSRGR